MIGLSHLLWRVTLPELIPGGYTKFNILAVLEKAIFHLSLWQPLAPLYRDLITST